MRRQWWKRKFQLLAKKFIKLQVCCLSLSFVFSLHISEDVILLEVKNMLSLFRTLQWNVRKMAFGVDVFILKINAFTTHNLPLITNSALGSPQRLTVSNTYLLITSRNGWHLWIDKSQSIIKVIRYELSCQQCFWHFMFICKVSAQNGQLIKYTKNLNPV